MGEAAKDPAWYLKPWAILAAILLVGPFAAPLILKSPALKMRYKIVLIFMLMILTVYFIKLSAHIYKEALDELDSLRDILKAAG